MKVLVMDNAGEGCGVDLAIRAWNADHQVRYWLPPFKTGDQRPYGDGLVPKVREWKPHMEWAELIVLTGNVGYMGELAEYFGKGFPIFGCNAKGAELECDREKGQEVLETAGVKILPYQVVRSADEAVELISSTRKAYAIKPWGGETDKSLTYISQTPDDALFTIRRWQKDGKLKGQLMFQEKVEGTEVGISGMFGPGGWCRCLEESFEYKKLMNGDLGENTGEQGTVIRHVTRSKLFDAVLEPITDYLHSLHYIGDCNINCIVDEWGVAWPLEFTARLGWPDFCIRQPAIQGDPVEWMAALLAGEDRFICSPEVVVGICLTHGDFPRGVPEDPRAKDPIGTWDGYPIYGIGETDRVHFQQAKEEKVPFLVGDRIEPVSMEVTAGNFPLIVTGVGATVEKARRQAYELAWSIRIPSNLMFRTDIGEDLEEALPLLQKQGHALGMRYR